MEISCQAYGCYFQSNRSSGYIELIAKNEIESIEILEKRYGKIDEDKTSFEKKDLDKGNIRDLTAGDLLRLIGKR